MIGPNPDESEEDWIFGLNFMFDSEPYISYDQRAVGFPIGVYEDKEQRLADSNMSTVVLVCIIIVGILVVILVIILFVYLGVCRSCKNGWCCRQLSNLLEREDEEETKKRRNADYNQDLESKGNTES